MRNVGLMAVFIFHRIIQIFLYYTSEVSKKAYILKRVGRNWIVFTYSVSLIGIPFLLIFMPETMGRSIFELEEVTISIADITPFRSTGFQDTEESVPE